MRRILHVRSQIANQQSQGEPVDEQEQICLFDGDSLSTYLGARQRAVARRRQHIQA